MKKEGFTVNDGDVSAFVVLGQREGSSLCRGHDAYCAAVVGALQVGVGTQFRGLDGQTLRQGEGLSGAVSTVGLVPPLDHWRLSGRCLVLARKDHRLEKHSVPLFLPHGDMYAMAHVR